jgi:hypothetical protein
VYEIWAMCMPELQPSVRFTGNNQDNFWEDLPQNQEHHHLTLARLLLLFTL